MILFLSAYPPRECGLASYSYQLIHALKEHFDSRSLSFEVCALEEGPDNNRPYPDEVRYTLDTSDLAACRQLAHIINANKTIKAVCVQHRFGLWGGKQWGENVLCFLDELKKPLAVVMHKVLPEPEQALQRVVNAICQRADLLITQTKHQAALLAQYYQVRQERVRTIPPGATEVPPFNKGMLRKKHQLEGKLVLSTFGLLRRRKGIEHVLEALDSIRLEHPQVVFMILGKTHPAASYYEGERYRIQLKDLIFRKGLQKHVRFVNRELTQEELQQFLCLSDIYVHTGEQGICSLLQAHACGCQLIAPPLPAVEELLQTDAKLVDVNDQHAIAAAVLEIAEARMYAKEVIQEARFSPYPYAWPKIALAYQEVVAELAPVRMHYSLPVLKADHLYRLTTSIGLQRADKYARLLTVPGYLLQDNAKALVAALLWYKQEPQHELLLLMLIRRFLNVIRKCQQPDGSFRSQLDEQGDYVPEQDDEQLQESSMQALWALSELIMHHEQLPADLPNLAQRLFSKSLPHISKLSSLPAIAFAIKALSRYNEVHHSETVVKKINQLASQLQHAYDEETAEDWLWFEPELRPGSSLLPEAMLLAWEATGQLAYKDTAHHSFGFLLTQLFEVVASPAKSKMGLPLLKEERFARGGDPQEVCYAVMMLDHFYQHSGEPDYLDKMYTAFSWFMGNNELHQSLYNPVSGACYGGLKQGKLNQEQGAESLVCYLMTRLVLDKYNLQLHNQQQPLKPARKLSIVRGVEVLADRPSMPSGQVKITVN